MTVKLQDKKVALKDGKVSCSCCGVTGCGYYPSQAFVDGLYTEIDLPDAVNIQGVSYSRFGLSYGNTVNGIALENNIWIRYRNGSRSRRLSLIQGDITDQFADTYLLTADINQSPYTQTVTRTIPGGSNSGCFWAGGGWDPPLQETEARLFYTLPYMVDNPDAFYKWRIEIGAEGGGTYLKDGPQSSPAGIYGGAITVS